MLFRSLLYLILCTTVVFGQFRDSAQILTTAPAGKPLRVSQFSIGSSDTNINKRVGTIAYLSGELYVSNGTYFLKVGGSGSSSADTATFVTKNTTQVIGGTKYYANRQYISSASIDTLFASPQNILEVAVSGREYTSIQSAINDATYGTVIVVYAGTYAENVSIADSGIAIVGISPQETKISGTVTVTAKKIRIANIRFDSTFTQNSQYGYSLREWNQYERCIFASDVFLGTASLENIYGYDFLDCNFVGYSDTLYVNQTGGWEAHTVIRGAYMMSEEAFDTYGKGYNLVLKSGAYLRFKDCSDLSFESIYFDCADSTIVLEFEKCRTVLIGSGTFTAANNATNFAVLSMNYGTISNWGHSTAWTFTGRFEVDFRWVSLTIPDIVWNSTAQSRWEWCEQRPFGSTATLTGTGLNKLHISNSIFKMDAPSGLATNRGNGWVQWIDN